MTIKDLVKYQIDTYDEMIKNLITTGSALNELLTDNDVYDENNADEEDKQFFECLSKVVDIYQKRINRLIEFIEQLKKENDFLLLLSGLCNIDSLLQEKRLKEEKVKTLTTIENHINANDNYLEHIKVVIDEMHQSLQDVDAIFYDMKASFRTQSFITSHEVLIEDLENSVQSNNYLPEEIWLRNYGAEGILSTADTFRYCEAISSFVEKLLATIKKEFVREKVVHFWSLILYHHILPREDEKEARKAFVRSNLYDDLATAIEYLEEGKVEYKPLVKTIPYSVEKTSKVYQVLRENNYVTCEAYLFTWLFNNDNRSPNDFAPINFHGRMSFLKKIIQELYGGTSLNAEFWNSMIPLFRVHGRQINTIGRKSEELTGEELKVMKAIKSCLKE